MRRIFLTACVAAIGTPALADLTAEDVLADHLNMLSGYGLIDVTANGLATTTGGLTVESFTGTYSDDEATVEVVLGGIDLVEQSDGSVHVIYPEQLPLSISTTPPADGLEAMGMVIALSDVTHVVSGSTTDLTHEVAFDEISFGEFTFTPEIEADEAEFEGEFALSGGEAKIRFRDDPEARDVQFALERMGLDVKGTGPIELDVDIGETDIDKTAPGNIEGAIEMTGLSGAVGYETGEAPRHTLELALGSLTWDQTIVAPQDDTDLVFDMAMSDFDISYDLQVSLTDLEESPADAIRAGQYARASASVAEFGYTFSGDTADGQMSGSTKGVDSVAELSLDRTGFRYAGSAGATDAKFSFPELPDLPISDFGYSIARTVAEVAFPVIPSDVPQDFVLRLAFLDLSTEDSAWNLFDPGAQLSRDPIDLEIDLEGTTILTSDLTEGDDLPLAETEARLNALRLSAVGTELTGSGFIRDTGSTPEQPKGEGQLNLMLVGGHTLLDTLVGMGLLPEDQAMGARMALGLFARPGDGADTLVSEIILNDDGTILANGQRIK